MRLNKLHPLPRGYTAMYCVAFWIIPQVFFAQAAVSASGNHIKSTGGALSFTVGQVVFTSKQGSTYQIHEGVQQVYRSRVTPVVELVHLREVSVFPNPTDDLLTIKISAAELETISFQVLDNAGKKITSGIFQAPQTDISLRELPAGTYHILLKTKQELRAFKVIKL